MDYRVELEQQPAQKALSIRTRAAVSDLPQVVGQAYGSIMQYLSETGENPSGAPFVAYYNMDMQDLDIEAGFPVLKALPGKDKVRLSEVPAGKYAACMHIGPYSKVEFAYNALTKWVDENGHTPTGVSYEFYLNDPAVTPEDQLQTRIMYQLR